MTSLITFPSLAEAQKAQMTMDVPLIVFVHSASEASDEEEMLNPRLKDLVTNRHYRKVFKSDIALSNVKGRTAQREALAAVLSHGLMEHVVLIHEVQEGTTAYSQLLEAVPPFTSVPRVHLLPSQRAMFSSPVVLCGVDFTPSNLIQYLQHMLRIPLGGAATTSSPMDGNTAKVLMRNLLDKVEALNVKRSSASRTSYVGSPLPPRPSTSPAVSSTASVKIPPSSTPGKKTAGTPGDTKVPPLPAPVKLPTATTATAAPATDVDAKKRPSLPVAKEESSPPTQRNKPEFISVRCSLPSGTSLTIDKLTPSSSSIRDNVRPVVRESLGHDNFDLVRAGPPPQRLNHEEHEGRPLQDIGITSSSALRVVVRSEALPEASAPRPQTVSGTGGGDAKLGRIPAMQGLQSLFGMLPGQGNRGNAPPPPSGLNTKRSSRPNHSSNIRTLDDVLSANQDTPSVMGGMAGMFPASNMSPGELPGTGSSSNPMAEMLKNLLNRKPSKTQDMTPPDAADEENDENEEDQQDELNAETKSGVKAFSGNGRRLRDPSDGDKKNN